jgi:hypothetical protein
VHADPIEVLAAFGGFEVAVMVGVMLMAASKRHLLMVDGLPACAALMVASRIAQPVTDYCVFCRSHGHRGLDQALNLFRASALLELGMESTDGTGATLAWPLVRSAAALLTEVVGTRRLAIDRDQRQAFARRARRGHANEAKSAVGRCCRSGDNRCGIDTEQPGQVTARGGRHVHRAGVQRRGTRWHQQAQGPCSGGGRHRGPDHE